MRNYQTNLGNEWEKESSLYIMNLEPTTRLQMAPEKGETPDEISVREWNKRVPSPHSGKYIFIAVSMTLSLIMSWLLVSHWLHY